MCYVVQRAGFEAGARLFQTMAFRGVELAGTRQVRQRHGSNRRPDDLAIRCATDSDNRTFTYERWAQ